MGAGLRVGGGDAGVPSKAYKRLISDSVCFDYLNSPDGSVSRR